MMPSSAAGSKFCASHRLGPPQERRDPIRGGSQEAAEEAEGGALLCCLCYLLLRPARFRVGSFRTMRLRQAAPVALELEPGLPRGLACSRLVIRCFGPHVQRPKNTTAVGKGMEAKESGRSFPCLHSLAKRIWRSRGNSRLTPLSSYNDPNHRHRARGTRSRFGLLAVVDAFGG